MIAKSDTSLPSMLLATSSLMMMRNEHEYTKFMLLYTTVQPFICNPFHIVVQSCEFSLLGVCSGVISAKFLAHAAT
jgi:hypothetical protein